MIDSKSITNLIRIRIIKQLFKKTFEIKLGLFCFMQTKHKFFQLLYLVFHLPPHKKRAEVL